ncbi:MAG: hypothetical protein ACTSVZ_10915 [Promethearchaeota archaeon]
MNLNKKRLYGNKYVNLVEGKIHLGPLDAQTLAKDYGTPSFLFLKDKIADNIQYIQEIFNSVFPDAVGFFSVKSNFLKPVLEVVRENNFGAEIISYSELAMLEQIEFKTDNIIAGGPYLPDEFLHRIVKARIPYIVVYDIDQIARLSHFIENSTNQSNEYKPNILLKFQTAKYTSRHGIPRSLETYATIQKIFLENPCVVFGGILSHFGTRLKTIIQYRENTNNLIDIIQNLRNYAHLEPKIINFGGGFPNADSIKKSDFTQFLQEIKGSLDKEINGKYSLFYEPGRFIVEDAGFCLCEVFKFDPISKTVFVNVGNNLIPKFMKSSLRFYNASRSTDALRFPVDIMGNVPSDQDILIKNYNFTEKVERGDIIIIANVGAYALTWSTRFPYAKPTILVLDGKNIQVFHDRKSSNDFSLQ